MAIPFLMGGGPIVINEINYNSADEFEVGDWVELYNSTSYSVDISNWALKDSRDDHEFVIPANVTIESKNYIVLCRNTGTFQSLFPGVINFIGDFNFGFHPDGELMRIFDSNQNLIDSVRYDDSAPWPTEPDGNGSTLELTDPFSDNELAENWRASSGNGTPGSRNGAYLTNSNKSWSLESFLIFDNYPNPFNSGTTLKYYLPHFSSVDVTIYDLSGGFVTKLFQGRQKPGNREIRWDGTRQSGKPIPTGVYMCRVQVGSKSQTTKMVFLK